MKKNPLISVIVPNYNHSNFLKQRLDSIFNQTYGDFEVIILDDASTDNSVKLIETYKNHTKVSHIVVNTINSGSLFKQWIKGIQLAKGQYIWIAESDDFAERTFLEETINVLKFNDNINLVYTDSRIVNENAEDIGLWSIKRNTFFNTERWLNSYENHGLDEILDFLLLKVSINNASAVLFRKESLLSMDLKILGEFKNAGDLFAYTNILLKGKISYIALPLNNFRTHSFNTTKENVKSGIFYLDAINCYSSILDLLLIENLNEFEKIRLSKAYKFFIKRYGFNITNFGYALDLKRFIIKLRRNRVFNMIEATVLLIGFRVYSTKSFKIKTITKKALIRILKK